MIASTADQRGSSEFTYGANGIIPPGAERCGWLDR